MSFTTTRHHARRARPRTLLLGVLAAALLLAAVGAGRAQAIEPTYSPYSGNIANKQYTVNHPCTPGYACLPEIKHYNVQPYSYQDWVVTFGDAGNPYWYRTTGQYGVYTGPKSLEYRMYKNAGNGKCLDVKQGSATAGADLTTAPCEWGRYSQWWAFDANGKLIPWHAATKNLVATTYIYSEWGFERLVLAPASGGWENKNQAFWLDGFLPPPIIK